MRNKARKMAALEQDLVKYCKQIGVIDIEVPKLVFHGEELNTIDNLVFSRLGRYGHKGTNRYTSCRGETSLYSRTILVNIRGSNTKLDRLRKTLVHELVHYRFMYMHHGPEFEKRINRILKGEEFGRKQIDVPHGRIKGC